jgi:hypothetical protein
MMNDEYACVYSKVIYGKIRCVAYDIIEPNQRQQQHNIAINGYHGIRPVKLREDRIILSSNQSEACWMLDQVNRNIHQLEAVEDCAFIDIMGPPYNHISRPCTYYKLISSPSVAVVDNDAVQWIAISEETEFFCTDRSYQGESIEGWETNNNMRKS